jgi:very-short-patch-repair endonuclease
MRQVNTKEQFAYMKKRQEENLARYVPAEEWAWDEIRKTGAGWVRQAIWGCRIFDFFSIRRGIAIEIDGDTHNKVYDKVRDDYNYYRSGILVLRIKNYNEVDLRNAIKEIKKGETRMDRRKRVRIELGLSENASMKSAVEAAGLKLAHCQWDGNTGLVIEKTPKQKNAIKAMEKKKSSLERKYKRKIEKQVDNFFRGGFCLPKKVTELFIEAYNNKIPINMTSRIYIDYKDFDIFDDKMYLTEKAKCAIEKIISRGIKYNE